MHLLTYWWTNIIKLDTSCTQYASPIAQQTVARRQISIEYESIPCVSNTEVSCKYRKRGSKSYINQHFRHNTRTVRHQHNLFQRMLTLRQLSVPNFSSILPKARVVRWFFGEYVHQSVSQLFVFQYLSFKGYAVGVLSTASSPSLGCVRRHKIGGLTPASRRWGVKTVGEQLTRGRPRVRMFEQILLTVYSSTGYESFR